jgi:hypothetical protein
MTFFVIIANAILSLEPDITANSVKTKATVTTYANNALLEKVIGIAWTGFN